MKNAWIIFAVYILLFQPPTAACPKCNQDFYKELLTNRANTLGGKELLRAIENQSEAGQEPNFTPPSAYNELTDIQEPVVSANTTPGIIEESAEDSESSISYYLRLPAKIFLITVVTGLIFFAGKYFIKFKTKKVS